MDEEAFCLTFFLGRCLFARQLFSAGGMACTSSGKRVVWVCGRIGRDGVAPSRRRGFGWNGWVVVQRLATIKSDEIIARAGLRQMLMLVVRGCKVPG